MQRTKEQLSFPAGGVKLYHAKRDTLSGFQLAGIQKNGCPTKAFGHDNFILLGAVPAVRNISDLDRDHKKDEKNCNICGINQNIV